MRLSSAGSGTSPCRTAKRHMACSRSFFEDFPTGGRLFTIIRQRSERTVLGLSRRTNPLLTHTNLHARTFRQLRAVEHNYTVTHHAAEFLAAYARRPIRERIRSVHRAAGVLARRRSHVAVPPQTFIHCEIRQPVRLLVPSAQNVLDRKPFELTDHFPSALVK